MAVARLYNKLSPFQRVIIALVLGIVTGVIVGEPAGHLQLVGDAYIRLLQMTVLPYVLVSIVGGLGRLDAAMAANIGIRAVKVILFVWLAVMLTLLLLPLAYPHWQTAGFFSTSLVAEPAEFNFVGLYIPANIFAALSNTIVPSVVLFSLLMGISLIKVENKDALLHLTGNIADGLMGIASFVARLAPIGIFAISAAAAGTLHPEDLGRLQVYLWVYLIAASLLAFVLLPLLIQWATPFGYRELVSTAGEAVITAAATGTVLVVLPLIVERCKEMLAKHGMDCEETDSTVDVLVPTAYSFPSTGTLLGLGFILFSAWYIGSPISLEQYPSYVIMGALTAFGSMAVAIPFMLDYFGLPADHFQLYLLGSVVTARVATALAALHGFTVTLLVASAVMKQLKWRRMVEALATHLGVTAGVMVLAGMAMTRLIPYEYTGVRTFEAQRLMDQPAAVAEIGKLRALSPADRARPRLDVIRERGTIRVGYFSDTLPFAFRNDQNMVVGFDMEIIHQLARDLGLKIELAHLGTPEKESQLLADGSLDITVGGRAITPTRALGVAFSRPYVYHTAAFIVRDNRREAFASMADIRQMESLNLGIIKNPYYQKMVKDLFPDARVTPIDTPRQYFKGQYKDVDALVFSAETGAAWAMLYPEYSVVVPKGLKLKAPVGLTLPKGQQDYVQFMNTWLTLKEDNGFLQRVYDYWILGENPGARKARWSVLHDVLGVEL
jgi:Na+/H+-dicarboxylate symporter